MVGHELWPSCSTGSKMFTCWCSVGNEGMNRFGTPKSWKPTQMDDFSRNPSSSPFLPIAPARKLGSPPKWPAFSEASRGLPASPPSVPSDARCPGWPWAPSCGCPTWAPSRSCAGPLPRARRRRAPGRTGRSSCRRPWRQEVEVEEVELDPRNWSPGFQLPLKIRLG